MKSFGGPVLFLDRSDINTDEIIPAKYLTEISKEALAPHLLEDLSLPGFDPGVFTLPGGRTAYGVIIARGNFGCGSSREHAPWALEMNGITTVVAEGFARIFRQNTFNCGMMAVELPKETIERLFSGFSNRETFVKVRFFSNEIPRYEERREGRPEAEASMEASDPSGARGVADPNVIGPVSRRYQGELTFTAGEVEEVVPFSLPPFGETLIKTGGWVEFADQRY